MRRTLRRLRGRHPSLAARRVSIRAQKPWYLKGVAALLLLVGGYVLACWQIYYAPQSLPDARSSDQKALLAQIVMMERQLQIERAAQAEVAREMTGLQDEVLRLKEDVQFYQSILSGSGNTGVVHFHSTKLTPGARPNVYRYSIVLVQSGRHDRLVDGKLHFKRVGGTGSGQVLAVGEKASEIPVKFKYYQRLEGELTIPAAGPEDGIQLELLDARKRSIVLSEIVPLPRT